MKKEDSKDTLRGIVKRYIIKGINDGTYKFGERIVETKLAKELELSQAPVREAILELSIMGILEERPYAGAFVRHPDREEVENHYRARGVIEAYAAGLAAQNRTEEQLQEMRSILDGMNKCTNPEDFVDLDHRFHGMIMDASGNNVIKRLWESISAYELTYQTILANRWSITKLHALHQKLYNVIEAGNQEAAGAEMFLHIDGFRNGIIAAMDEKEKES